MPNHGPGSHHGSNHGGGPLHSGSAGIPSHHSVAAPSVHGTNHGGAGGMTPSGGFRRGGVGPPDDYPVDANHGMHGPPGRRHPPMDEYNSRRGHDDPYVERG